MELLDKVFQYANVITAIGVVLLWLTILILIIIAYVKSKIENKHIYKAIIKTIQISENINEIQIAITNEFELYRRHRFGFSSNNIIELCQEVERKIKLQNSYAEQNDNIKKIESVIAVFKDQYRFDEEKMNEVIKNVNEKIGVEEARKIREYLVRMGAYYDGRIFEKDRQLKDVQERVTRKKWFNIIIGIIGFVGSIASIYSIFIK
ncbi:hypothetical protein [Lachnospira eligens]|jgi:hypothetical protein|uniref:Uncharacterized protein n=1 Tax=Lachnospira eligens TaxID=39485 RepID=A0A414DGN0_9FIRM|nr:hypothetical protein [Lachnospira eligens]RHD09884.1 hypothetical protein DW811_05075 [Lachnospira eligens]